MGGIFFFLGYDEWGGKGLVFFLCFGVGMFLSGGVVHFCEDVSCSK